jgi:hypothetical protein
MNERIDQAHLKLLGYCSKWVEYGFLSPELLLAQVARFHAGDDKSTEHFRYAAFRRLQQRDVFSDQVFEQYLELATLDPDPKAMGRAALIDLIYHPGLTEAQWETVLAHPRVQELPKLIKQVRLLKELRGPNVTEETLQRCVDEGDGDIHRRLLDRSDLPHRIVEALHRNGANKVIRNVAGMRLEKANHRAPR